ncbi:MAG: AAA-like domain-containing protein [Coleofasciculus sp. G2-EDA-02]
MSDSNYYKVGGSLEYQHPTYVVRNADAQLYQGLINGEFCYVLNSRQMGKSSLRVQMTKKLKAQGVKCATIDMTRIGSHVTPEEWYGGLVSELLRGFRLSRKINFSNWWRDREVLSPVQRLSEFIDDVLLIELSDHIVIFIDEIDSIIKIPFRDDFFALLRACYNQRVDNPDYQRLTFCLLGVATPSDLIASRTLSTPFNIGTAIELTGFNLDEVSPLVQGLETIVSHPRQVIAEVLEWTGGQPFLTQKLCKLIVQESELDTLKSSNGIEALVRENIIENWEAGDEPEHLRTIRDRIKWSPRQKPLLLLYQPLLLLYQQILHQGEVKAKDTPEQMELRLSGLVVKQQGKLRVANRIYQAVFNQTWLDELLAEADVLSEVANSERKTDSTGDLSAATTTSKTPLVKIITNKPGEGFISDFLVDDKLIRIYQGDITNLAADVIVSSDDTYLSMRGGVSRRIRRMGGNKIYSEGLNFRMSNALSIGDVAVTSAGNLQAKKIFHGAVIDWQLELFPSKKIIQKVVHDCLRKANDYGYKTIVFPLLGTGAGCLDKQIAWEMMLKQIIMDLSTIHQTILEVCITLYDRETAVELNPEYFLDEVQNKWLIKVIKHYPIFLS